jgi:hypothetical protein
MLLVYHQLSKSDRGVADICPTLASLAAAAVAAVALMRQGHAAVEFALRYPYLISSKKQLEKVARMLNEAPDALGLPLQQLLPCFVAHPDLFKYGSAGLLAQRYDELAACLNRSGELLALGLLFLRCCYEQQSEAVGVWFGSCQGHVQGATAPLPPTCQSFVQQRG